MLGNRTRSLTVIVPAAGIGQRMQADRPKQYLSIMGKTVLEHTVFALLAHPSITKIVIALASHDDYFSTLSLHLDSRVVTVIGGKERADSVLAGLAVVSDEWVLVHDAARPCVTASDIDLLIDSCFSSNESAILAIPVRDTMKQSTEFGTVDHTVDRRYLWHALTPQMMPTKCLRDCLVNGLKQGKTITDEASALEGFGFQSKLIQGRSDNLKITQPEDLALAAFYLQQRGITA